MIASWPCPSGGDEFALAFDKGRKNRLLVIPALFDEANKTRHLVVETMRRLDGSGIDCFLPDLPGWNESLAPLEEQTLAGWREAAQAAAAHFAATHLMTIRAGAVLAPAGLPGWRYAPIGAASALKALLRARVVSAREAGRDESTEGLLEHGMREGLDLAGHKLGAALVAGLDQTQLPDSGTLRDIDHQTVGGPAPWLRAEPDFDPAQADALAAIVAVGLAL
jgi:hypothetical protein